MQYLGYALMAAPFVGFTIYSVRSVGLPETLANFAVTGTIIGCLVGGAFLIGGGA